MKNITHFLTRMTGLTVLSLLTATAHAQETWIIDNTTTTLTSNDQLTTTENLALGNGTSSGNFDLNGFNQTVANFYVRSQQADSVNTVTITPDRTFTVSGNMGVMDPVADGGVGFGNYRTFLTMTGGGHFIMGDGIDSSFGAWRMHNRSVSGDVDMTGLASFTANLGAGMFRVGVRTGNPTQGMNLIDIAPTIRLAADSTIHAGVIQIGDANFAGPNTPSTLLLGTGANVLNADEIRLGAWIGNPSAETGSSSARLGFQSATDGTVTIRGTEGTIADRANFTVGGKLSGFNIDEGRSVARDNRAEFAGHTADILLNTLVIGEDDAIGNETLGNRSTHLFSFDAGVLDVNQAYIGRVNTTRAGFVDGYSLRSDSEVNLGGGNVVINNGVDMARFEFVRAERSGVVLELNAAMNISGGSVTINDGASNGWAIRLASIGADALSTDSAASGSLAITGGILNVGGDIIDGGLAGTVGSTQTSIVLDGGTLNMNGNAIGDAVNPIDTLTFASGTLSNVSEINNGATVVKTSGGTLVMSGSLGYTGETSVANGTLQLDGTHTGGELITVGAGGTLSGNGSTLSAVTIDNAGTLSPGNSIGEISLGDLTLNDGAIIDWGFQDVTSYDRILAQSGTSLTLSGGTVTFEITGDASLLNLGDTFTIYDGSVVGFDVNSFMIVDNSGWTNESNGNRWELSEGSLQITAIPEPSTLALCLIMIGVFSAGAARRKRR